MHVCTRVYWGFIVCELLHLWHCLIFFDRISEFVHIERSHERMGGRKKMVLGGGTHNLCRIETASYFWSVWMKPKFVILIVLCRKEFSFSGRELWWSEELEAWLTQDFSLPLPLSSCLESLLKSRKEWKQHFIRWHCILSSLIPNKSI